MSNRAELATDGTLLFWCPGCNEVHGVPTSRWEWDGRLDLPTLKPSIVIRSTRYGPDKLPHPVPDSSETYQQVCHSYVREGRIEFLSDCTHALAGQTVDLPEWDDQPVTLVT